MRRGASPPRQKSRDTTELAEARLTTRLAKLPAGVLAQVAADAMLVISPGIITEPQSRACRQRVENIFATHTPVPQWAVSGVLLSPDLLHAIFAPFVVEDGRVAAVCKVWHAAWEATAVTRRGLRRAIKPRLTFENGRFDHGSVVGLTPLACGHLLLIQTCKIQTAENGEENESRQELHVVDWRLRCKRSWKWPWVPCRSSLVYDEIAAGEHGLYSTYRNRLSRHFVSETTFSENLVSVDREEHGRGEYLLAVPGGLLYEVYSVPCDRPAGGVSPRTSFIAALDPLILREKFRFGTDHLGLPSGIALLGEELYVFDTVPTPNFRDPVDLEVGRLQVFTLNGEYRRTVTSDDIRLLRHPTHLHAVSGLLYATESGYHPDPCTCVLTPDGGARQIYDYGLADSLFRTGCIFKQMLILGGHRVEDIRVDSDEESEYSYESDDNTHNVPCVQVLCGL